MTQLTKAQHEEMLKETFRTIFELMLQKNADYTGDTDDPYANFRLATLEGIHPMRGVMLRVQDKMQRIRTFIGLIESGEEGILSVPGETVEDAFSDIIGYMQILRGLSREYRVSTMIEAQPAELATDASE